MPSLTLQRDANVGDATRADPRGPDGGPDGPGPVGGLGDSYPEFSFDRDASDAGGDAAVGDAAGESGRSGGAPADGRSVDEGRAGGEGSTVTSEAADDSAELSPGVEELLSPDGPELLAYDADVDRVVDRLYRELERKMRIERERRGY